MKVFHGNVKLPKPNESQWLIHDDDLNHYLVEDYEHSPSSFLNAVMADYRGNGTPVIVEIRGREVFIFTDC